jgi:hypothetical protein
MKQFEVGQEVWYVDSNYPWSVRNGKAMDLHPASSEYVGIEILGAVGWLYRRCVFGARYEAVQYAQNMRDAEIVRLKREIEKLKCLTWKIGE